MKHHINLLWIAGGLYLSYLVTIKPVQAQVSSDGTLSTNVTTTDNRNFTITKGDRAGNNLFHSFSQFSVPPGGSAFFDNAPDIQNIISRVTGGSLSQIDGLIKANPMANLFLLNPNGIIFGPNASLNIGGSFLASTASRLNFADGTQFNATAPQATPLLTISVPIGLQFGENAGKITVQGNGQGLRSTSELIDSTVGLRVQQNQTLALVGGDVELLGGTLKTAGGRIELGSVAGSSLVSLTSVDKGWTLGYSGVQNFRDIQLSQRAAVDASGAGGGDIQVRGRRVTLTDGSQIEASTLRSEPGGTLAVNASESVELRGSSVDGEFRSTLGALVYPEATGAGDSLILETQRLRVSDGAQIRTSTFGAGNAGALRVHASDSVELSGKDSGLLARANRRATGSGGNLTIETKRLNVRNGAQIAVTTSGAGNAGTLTVHASDSVELSGEGQSLSGLFAQQATLGGTGSGGNLIIETKRLNVRNGAQIAVTTSGAGNAGTLRVHASDSVELSGKGQFPNGLFAQAEPQATGDGGNLTIETQRLSVRDGARVTVRSLGTGKAGNLIIDPDLVQLDRGTLTAQTLSGEGGDITIQGGSIQLLNNSRISTEAGGNGNGGNITINADTLVGLQNSDIVADANNGQGGVVKITAQGVFGLERSKQRTDNSNDITAFSQKDPSLNGVVEINTPDFDPSQGLVTLPANLVDISGLIAQGCAAGDGATGSIFTVTGRGGLPPNPSEPLSSDVVWEDTRLPATAANQHHSETVSATPPSNPAFVPIVEATGWVFNDKGEVTLTAKAPNVTPYKFGSTPVPCRVR